MTETRGRFKRLKAIFKLGLSIFSGLFILLSAGLFYAAHNIEPLVTARIKETIETATDGLYSISFSRIEINPLTGNIILNDIRFRANLREYQRLKQTGLNPTHIYDIAVKRVVLKKTNPIKVYLRKELHVEALVIERPSIKVYYQHPRNESAEPEDKRTTWQRLSKYLKSIEMEKIFLFNIDFKYIDGSLGRPEINGVKNLSIEITDLLIDSLSRNDRSRFYYTKDISVQVMGEEFLSPDNNYKVVFDELNISSSGKYADLKGFRLIPRFPEMPFVVDKKTKRGRFGLNAERILLKNIDFKKLTDRRQLRASALELKNASLDIFMNRMLPKKVYDRSSNFPALVLKRFRLNTIIDTIKLTGSSLTYSEYNPLTARKGRIFFNNMEGHILNFTNDSLRLEENDHAKAKFKGLLFGKAQFSMLFDFDLNSADAAYRLSGTVSDLNVRNFNQLTRPLALLQINSGRVTKGDFNIEGNVRQASGTLRLKYTGLNIGILKIDSNKMIRKQMLMSMVANNLLINEDNPLKGQALREGTISYTRPDSVAFLGMIWKSLYSGIKETIGLTAERQNDLKKQFGGFKQEKVKEKARELRREKREGRRGRRN